MSDSYIRTSFHPKRSIRPLKSSRKRTKSKKMKGHVVSKLPLADLALLITAVGLAALGTVAHFHIGVLAHLGDAGTAYLAYGAWGGAGLFVLIELGYRAIKACTSSKKPKHSVRPKYSYAPRKTKRETVKNMRETLFPPNEGMENEHFFTYDHRTRAVGTIPYDIVLGLNETKVAPYAKSVSQAKKKMAKSSEEAVEFGRTTGTSGPVRKNVEKDLREDTSTLRDENTTYVTLEQVSVATTQPTNYTVTELSIHSHTAQFYSLSDPVTSSTPSFIDKLPSLVEMELKKAKKIDERTISNALTAAFVKLNKMYLKDENRNKNATSGSCILVLEGKAYVANVGNCRVVRRRIEEDTVCLTRDTPHHHLGLYERTAQNSLELACPQITSLEVKEGDTFIMATPGFWEYASLNDIHMGLFHLEDAEKGSSEEITTRLTSAAKKAGSEGPSTFLTIKIK